MWVKKTFLAVAAMLLSIICNAQTTIPVYTIRHAIEMNISELTGHPEWGFTSLKRNVHRKMTAAPKVLQPQQTIMTPEQLYKQRHESALIFGKAGLCGQCPELHVVLIATVTPVSEDGVCLVNHHMVQPIVSPGKTGSEAADSIYFVADRDGQCYPITSVLAYAVDEDAAVIKVDTRGNKLPAIPIGLPAETGQHVNLITHPKQMFYTYTQGYVTRNALYNFPGNPIIDLMEISADFAEGSSGGPVMDDCGNLIGMVRATTSIFHDEERRNPQMVRKTTIPVKFLKKLLAL